MCLVVTVRSLEERYNFLVSRLRVEDPDYWEGDAILTMKSFCFGFYLDNPDEVKDMNNVIDLAIESVEWDAKHNVNNMGGA